MRWVACALFAVAACRDPAPRASGTRPGALPLAPAFVCRGSSCVQRHPRMPDDGDWICADRAGATLCVGGAQAAGVSAAPPDPRWRCGARRGPASDQLGGRVCFDLGPDFPDGKMAGWRCRTVHDPPVRRVCDRDPDARTLADACDAARPCIDGGVCQGGRCAPAAAAPDCWLDGDCPGRRCRLGSCGEGRP